MDSKDSKKMLTAYIPQVLYSRIVAVQHTVGAPSISKLIEGMLEQYCTEVERENTVPQTSLHLIKGG